MNWQYLVTVIVAVLGPVATWLAMRPKTGAEIDKLQVEVTEKVLQLMDRANDKLEQKIAELNKELEKWKAEVAVQKAVYDEKELKLATENAELRVTIRKGGEERRMILDAQKNIQVKFDIQMSAMTALQDEIKLVRIAMDRMEAQGPPSDPASV